MRIFLLNLVMVKRERNEKKKKFTMLFVIKIVTIKPVINLGTPHSQTFSETCNTDSIYKKKAYCREQKIKGK